MDQRKRKRMQSNRESARRSRMRKQKHLDELMQEVDRLKIDNNQILASINIATQHLISVEAENSILRAQFHELSQRLDSLNEILNFINTSNGVFETDHQGLNTNFADSFVSPMAMNMAYLNQPIMASADMFQY